MVNTQVRPLTNAEYYQMIESGIIREGERVELIAGQIFTMAAKGTRHTLCTRKLFKQLLALVGDLADVQSQDPITLPNNSEPEPDIVIAKLRSDNYIDSHPSPVDIILVIEVADSTIRFDREVKAPLYAAAGIGEYWIVNLLDDCLEIYRQPENGTYKSIEVVRLPNGQRFFNQEMVGLPQFPAIKLRIGDFFVASKNQS